MEGGPIAGGFAGAPVDHQVGWTLGDVRVEVVHEHAQGGFLLPSPAAQGCAAGCADDGGHGFIVAPGGSDVPCGAVNCWSARRPESQWVLVLFFDVRGFRSHEMTEIRGLVTENAIERKLLFGKMA
jgi:hypothetical protein